MTGAARRRRLHGDDGGLGRPGGTASRRARTRGGDPRTGRAPGAVPAGSADGRAHDRARVADRRPRRGARRSPVGEAVPPRPALARPALGAGRGPRLGHRPCARRADRGLHPERQAPPGRPDHRPRRSRPARRPVPPVHPGESARGRSCRSAADRRVRLPGVGDRRRRAGRRTRPRRPLGTRGRRRHHRRRRRRWLQWRPDVLDDGSIAAVHAMARRSTTWCGPAGRC